MSEAPSPSPRRSSDPLDLGEILLETTDLTLDQLVEAQRIRDENGRPLADVLVGLGWVSAEQVLEALGRRFGLPIRPQLAADQIDETLIEKVPISFAKNHVLLPL